MTDTPQITMKPTGKEAAKRIHGVDFTKGILVVFMVIYHSLNYVEHGSGRHFFLVFVPPSFIMITGFIITQIYLKKYGTNANSLSIRLGTRSLKILAIFTILNVGIRTFLSKNAYGVSLDLNSFLTNWINIYVAGSPRLAAFDILLPIGYLLFMAIFVAWLQSKIQHFISFIAVSMFFLCIVLAIYGQPIYNLQLISSGFIGMAFGLLPFGLINKFVQSLFRVSFLFLLYIVCVLFSPDTYYSQIFLTILSLILIYAAGMRVDATEWLSKEIIRLGKYSLLSYIIQIGYLYAFMKMLAFVKIEDPDAIFVMVVVLLISWISVFVLDFLRSKNKAIDSLYKMVFA